MENMDCGMEEGLKEGKSLENLPDNKENMEDSEMNDLLEEESNGRRIERRKEFGKFARQ